MADTANIGNMIKTFVTLFPNYVVTEIDLPKVVKLWHRYLAEIPVETLNTAIEQLITEPNRKYAPSIGEVRGAALKLNMLASGIPDAYSSYSEVVGMPAGMTKSAVVFEDGMNIIEYRKLSWSHPFVGRVAEMIGWPKLFPTGEPGVDRAQWVKFYDQELTRQMSESGRLPAVQAYIDERKGKTFGTMPALGDLSNLLDVSR